MLAITLITNRFKAASRVFDTDSWHKQTHISLLEGLPVELLRSIACFLPPSAAASFALTSKYIWYAVGSQYWHQLPFQPLEYEIFLGLLEKTMARHWLCDECRTFHSYPKYGSLFRNSSELPAWKCNLFGYRYLISPDTSPFLPITYLKLRMAINRHLFGPEQGRGLDIFSTSAGRDSFKHGRCSQSTEACIVADELYMRCQTRTAIPFSKNFEYIEPQSICPHISSEDPEEPMMRIIKCLLSRRDTGSREEYGRLRQCRYCHTEFKIQISRFGSAGHILEITYWKNFGPGRNDRDQKWARHQFSSMSCRDSDANFSPGSIQAAFESENRIQMKKPLSRLKRALGRVRVALSSCRVLIATGIILFYMLFAAGKIYWTIPSMDWVFESPSRARYEFCYCSFWFSCFSILCSGPLCRHMIRGVDGCS